MSQIIYAVVGPTASGKTGLAIELAKKLNAEIISCDSMQIYKEMNIGTAKPTPEERAQVPHHLVDCIGLERDFSCADYKDMAESAIEDIVSRGKNVLFCGGTGMYLDNLLTDSTLSDSAADENYRAGLEVYGNDTLHEMLEKCDPISAQNIHKNNRKRVIRALEIYHSTGMTKTEWDARSRIGESRYIPKVIMPVWEREVLYDRINRRVDQMLEQGLIDECRRLRSKIENNRTASQAIGYKELFDYLDGKESLQSASEKLKTATRNYAKRQLTWFNHRDYVRKVEINLQNIRDEIVNSSLMVLTY